MTGGTTSVDDMIRSTQRGVPVTRLWYLREVDPRTILYTGLTRDGTFLIENGKISKAVKNFRLWCPVFLLCFCASVFLGMRTDLFARIESISLHDHTSGRRIDAYH
jgi:PmbA/TldA metallopeptidase C-terminal domain